MCLREPLTGQIVDETFSSGIHARVRYVIYDVITRIFLEEGQTARNDKVTSVKRITRNEVHPTLIRSGPLLVGHLDMCRSQEGT